MTITPPPFAPASSSSVDGRTGDFTLAEALVLNRVTDRAWQVCDSRYTPHSPGYLLGFVEETPTGVELMQLGDKFIWTGFPTMHDALTHVAGTASVTATERAAGDLAWIQ